MDKKMPKFAKRLLVIVPCAIAALIVVAGCFDIVPAGYKGVKLTMGAVGDTVLNEGLAFKLPFAQRIVHVDARVKKYTVEGETSASKDMQSITTNVAVNYRVDGANVDELYKNLSLNYEDTLSRRPCPNASSRSRPSTRPRRPSPAAARFPRRSRICSRSGWRTSTYSWTASTSPT